MSEASIPTERWFNPLDDFEQPETPEEQAAREISEAEADLNDAILKTFSTRNGRKVLEWLERMAAQPCFTPGAGYEYGFWREGQNEVLRTIKFRMNQARNS